MPTRRFALSRAVAASLLAASPAAAQIVTQNYTATSLDVLDPDTFAAQEPPDTMGSVGVRDFTQFINFEFTVFDKSTGAVRQRIDPATFWSNAGVDTSSATAVTDPRVVYDPVSRRWFASMVDVSADEDTGETFGGNHILFAVSQTSDPAGPWKGTQFLADPSGTRLADFPRLGMNHDGVFLITDNFDPAASEQDLPQTITIAAFNKSDLTLATPNFSNGTMFFNLDPNNTGLSAQPVISTGPSTGKEHFISIDANAFSTLDRFDVTGTSNASVGPTSMIIVPATNTPPGARQPDTSDTVDTNDDRFSAFVFKVGNSIWGAQSTALPANGRTPRAAVRWYQMDSTTNALIQPAGTLSDSVADLYMPSIAANQFGDVVIGYTRSSPTEYPSAYVSIGHTTNGVTTFDAPILLHAGNAAYDPEQFGIDNRWGDYSSTTVDPADPWTFFAIQEWADEDTDFELGKWATQVSEIILPHANEARWSAPTSGMFSDNNSWLQSTAPATTDHAIFSRATAIGASYTVTFAGNVTNTELSIRQGTVTLDLSSHAYTLTSNATSIAIAEYGGEPSVTFSNGNINSINTTIAADPNAFATVNLSATHWTNTGNFSLAGTNTTQGGSATLTLPADSSVTIGGTLRIWQNGSLTSSAPTLSANSIDLNAGSLTLTPGGNKLLLTTSLTLENNAHLDLADNDALIAYTGTTPAASIRALLIAGYNNGTWDGAGIASSVAVSNTSHLTALGYAEAADVGVTNFDGQSIAGPTLLIKYTYVGDSSLDGKVDLGNDFNLFLEGYLNHGSTWELGDYNYDGQVTTADFQLFIDAYKAQGSSLGLLDNVIESSPLLTTTQKSQLLSAVPEPTTILAIFLPLALPVLRRHRLN